MGSDNVLEWKVMTTDGSHLVATPNQHLHLYWALSGGGGTFAVVLSIIVRLHPGDIVGGTILSSNDSVVGNDTYWEDVRVFQTLLPAFLDIGNSFTYSVDKITLTVYGTMPGTDLDQVNTLLKPFQEDLANRGIAAQTTPNVELNYYRHFYDYLGPAPLRSAEFEPFINSRICPRAIVVDPNRNAIVIEVLRNVSLIATFSPFYCDSFNVSYQAHSDNTMLLA